MSRFDDRASQVDRHTVQPLSLNDLPPPNTNRWVIRRKAELVAAVRGGLISLEEVCERYQLSVEEFQTWQESLDQHGIQGLRTTRLQFYRKTPARNEHGARNGNTVLMGNWNLKRNSICEQAIRQNLLGEGKVTS